MPRDELTLNDEDVPVAHALIEKLVRPSICDLTRDSVIWPRRKREGTAMGPTTIVEHWLLYVGNMVPELARLTRERETLTGEVGDHMERFAGLPRDADDKHATVFAPAGQLVPPEVLARAASTDTGIRLHSAEFVLAYERRTKSKAELPWLYKGDKGDGAMANVLALVVNGVVVCDGRFRHVSGPVDARPLTAMGKETADAMIARLAADMLHDFNKAIERLRTVGEVSAALTLRRLPFLVEHQDWGAPLARKPHDGVSDHFVPGTSHALVRTILAARRPLAAMANARLGMEHLDRSIGHLRYDAHRLGRPMNERQLLTALRDLAHAGALDGSTSKRLLEAVAGTLLNPSRAPDACARVQLRGALFVAGGRDRGAEAIQMYGLARITPTNEVQLFVLRGRPDEYGLLLKALEARYSHAGRIAHLSCLSRWRKRAGALFVLNGGAGAHLRSGIEAAVETANWIYILAALRR
ncbi:MAG TPA: hypothetical protein VFY45_18440 [Baekduia sp.]|nr:hypothetical protein [Baekduia sp.]